MANMLDRIKSRLPQPYSDSDDSKLIQILNAIATEIQTSSDNTDTISKMDDIDNTLDGDLYVRWGALLMVPRLSGETEYAYRTRLKLAITSLNGGTMDTVKYSIAVGLNADNTDNIFVLDGWEYNDIGNAVTTVTKTGQYVSADQDGASAALITNLTGNYAQDISVWGTNLITNGDFSNGTTGWATIYITITTANNEATFTPINQYTGIKQGNTLSTHKYYFSAWVKATSSYVKLLLRNVVAVAHSGGGSYERLSAIGTPSADINNDSAFSIEDWRTSGFSSISVKNAIAIDLTAIFGAGKEPTKAQVDAMLAQYPNSWFNGKARLTNDIVTYTPNSPSPDYPAPITNASNFDVVACGKNLFDKGKVTNGYRLGAGNLPFADGATALTDYIRVQENTVYVRTGSHRTVFYNASNTIIDATLSTTFTTPPNTFYLRTAFDIVNLGTAQLELGSVSTPYEPHKSNKLTIPQELRSLPNGVCDTIERGLDGITRHIQRVGKKVLDGNVVVGSGTKIGTVYRYVMNGAVSSVSTQNGISTHFKFLASYTSDTTHFYIQNTQIWLFTIFASAEFQSWLSANPVTVYYELATPIITILPDIVIDTYAGITNIITNSNPQVSITAEFKNRVYGIVRGVDPMYKMPGNIICIIDMNDGMYNSDVEAVVRKAINDVKAAGVNAYISFYNYRVVYYISLDEIPYATLNYIEYNKIGE